MDFCDINVVDENCKNCRFLMSDDLCGNRAYCENNSEYDKKEIESSLVDN